MRKNPCTSVVFGLCFFSMAPLACGDDSDASPGSHGETGQGDSTANDGADDAADAADGDPGADAGDGGSTGNSGADADADDDAADSGTTDGCRVWEITYDLSGSEFEIADTPLGAGNQVNTVAEPHRADDHVGPGTFVLRFQNDGGQPGSKATIAAYEMALHFVVSGTVTVATDIETQAGPEACGITSGALEDTTVAWEPSAIVGLHRQGQVLCTGSLCSLGGLPNGTPEPVDETEDQPLSAFVFSGDLNGFTMAKTVIQQDSSSTTTWTYVGTEVGRELVDAPACACD